MAKRLLYTEIHLSLYVAADRKDSELAALEERKQAFLAKLEGFVRDHMPEGFELELSE